MATSQSMNMYSNMNCVCVCMFAGAHRPRCPRSCPGTCDSAPAHSCSCLPPQNSVSCSYALPLILSYTHFPTLDPSHLMCAHSYVMRTEFTCEEEHNGSRLRETLAPHLAYFEKGQLVKRHRCKRMRDLCVLRASAIEREGLLRCALGLSLGQSGELMRTSSKGTPAIANVSRMSSPRPFMLKYVSL